MASRQELADVLVIGAGASGAAFTWSLTEAGVKVVSLEQGGWVSPTAFPVNEPQAQLHWQTDFHPNPNFRGLPEDYPVNEDDTPIAPYMYNAVGGSTIHWGSHFPRFHPSDFRVKSLDGVADDWPMDYFELEPYYDLNDRMHGVSGLQGDPAYPPKPVRPTPPLPIGRGGELLGEAFNKLGWHWWSSDNAVHSTSWDGRPADVGEYLRSPSGSDIIFWPKALRQGARLITHARVREILVDDTGRATGAAYYDRHGELQAQYARVVALACNGIGTSRLLLNSRSALFPDGLANSSGQVGRNLMHHPCGYVLGLFDEDLGPDWGPRGSSMLSQEFYETDLRRGFARGYDMQISNVGGAPLQIALGGLVGETVPWGDGHHRDFAERFHRQMGIVVMSEDLPEAHNRVTLDPNLTDAHGIPAPKIDYTVSDNTWAILDHGIARANEALEAAGATRIVSSRLRRNAGWHLLGTARMGADPDTSVVDRWGRAHDVPNLFIIDGSIFTTGACINPTTTIQALALRTADYLKGEGSSAIA